MHRMVEAFIPLLSQEIGEPVAPVFGRDRICGVVAAEDAATMLQQLAEGVQHTSVLELRLDWLPSLSEIRRFLAMVGVIRTTLPGFSENTLVATCRRRAAGGKFRGSVGEQLRILRAAVEAGCSWVDLEIESFSGFRNGQVENLLGRSQCLVSYHDFRRVPANLRAIVRRLRHQDADAIKIAVQARTFADAARLLHLAEGQRDVVAVPMGDTAFPARILMLKHGSALAYAAVENATAPGQISLEEMKGLYRAHRTDAGTRIYGVIGNPVGHSLSPRMHNAGFEASGMNAVYLPFNVPNLGDFLGVVRSFGLEGFSVTLPHKRRIIKYIHRCDPIAAAIGAVNTVVVGPGGNLSGYNTDYLGIQRALENRMVLAKSRTLILGAGGAARAAAFALTQAGAGVRICARRAGEARKLAHLVKGQAVPRSALRREDFDLIVNATPVGMHPHEDGSPLAVEELNARFVFDLIYRPRTTRLMQLAAKRGIETISGVEMFVAQGLAQWEIWTGCKAPVKAMRQAVETALESEEKARADV